MQIDHIVFYGTLMSKNTTTMHVKIKDGLIYQGVCMFKGTLYTLGRYPGLKSGKQNIHGELYKIIDNELLTFIDKYEAMDNEDNSLPGFKRELIKLVDPKISAWVYYYDGSVNNKQLIESGKWQ